MKPRTILAVFDIDDTLIQSASLHGDAYLYALEKFGLLGFDTNWSNYKHHTDSYIFKTIFEKQYETGISEQDFALFEMHLVEYLTLSGLTNKILEIKGASDFLRQIAHDIDIVFATGSLLKPAKLKLQQAGIAVDDNLIIAANGLYTREELVMKAIEQAKLFYKVDHYKQIISFGDGFWDYQTAINLNIDFIGVHNHKLIGNGVKYFFPDYTNPSLLTLLKIEDRNHRHLNFNISSTKAISKTFTENQVFNFQQAIEYIRNLRYGRNVNKSDLTTLFADGCGTCSTKHALLKQLAIENNAGEVKLIVGIFKMNEINTPEVSNTLKQYGLQYIPEAHCYLRINDTIIDATKLNSSPNDFIHDLICEVEIVPTQIETYKVNYHQEYLNNWLHENIHIKYTLSEIWTIREQCIRDLETHDQV
jgi:phosphoglycolate phosphatase-like HAD superfamily hydrolase